MTTMIKTSSNTPNENKKRAVRTNPIERRRQLIACAVSVCARRGLENTGHAQIAEAAGVSTATVFLYLSNRQAIIDSVLESVDDYLINLVEGAIELHLNAAENLLAITRAYAAAIDSDPDHIKIFLNWSTVVRDETWPQYVDFQDRIIDSLENIIRSGIKSGELPGTADPITGAHLVMGAAHMIAQMKFRDRGARQIDDFCTALIRGALLGH